MRALIVIVILAIGGFLVWTQVGGEEKSVPNAPGTPDLPSGDQAGHAATSLMDKIYAAPPWIWTGVAALIVIVVINSIRQKAPVLFWIIVGALIGITIYVASRG